MAEITFEITKELGVISENAKGWTRELNLVSWNEREPKYDIRDWNADHTRMSKGISMTEEEMQKRLSCSTQETRKIPSSDSHPHIKSRTSQPGFFYLNF